MHPFATVTLRFAPLAALLAMHLAPIASAAAHAATARDGGAKAAAPAGALPERALLPAVPADGQEIGIAMAGAVVGAPIVLHGRIVHGSDVFAKERAEFLLVDDAAAAALAASASPDADAAQRPCAAPPAQRAVIRVVDGQGQPLATALGGRHGLVPGAEVFVVGTVASADRTSLTVNATGLHVPRGSLPAGAVRSGGGTTPPSPEVAAAKGAARVGAPIVLRGRVGGGMAPFVAGRAVVTVIGRGPKACSEIPGDACRTPWDYCCETPAALLANSATIRFVDAKGAPLRTDLKGRAGMRELSELEVEGTVAVAENGVLVVDARRVVVVER